MIDGGLFDATSFDETKTTNGCTKKATSTVLIQLQKLIGVNPSTLWIPQSRGKKIKLSLSDIITKN